MPSTTMEVLLCRWIRPHHYVVLMGSLSILAFVIAYAIAVTSGNVDALFPYISETGTKPPESCIFGFLLNLSSVIAFVCMFIRRENFADQIYIESQYVHFWNDLGLFVGFLSALGMSIVANFQETNVLSVHLVGASMVFGFGVIYCWIQTYLSSKSSAYGLSSRCTVWFRCLLSIFVTFFFIFTFTGASIATYQWKNGNHGNDTQLKWTSDDSGYDWHLVSTFSEWLMAFSFICFFFTFYREFTKIRITTKVHQPCDPDLSRASGDGILT